MIPQYPVGTVFECRKLGFNNWREKDNAGNEIALQFATDAEARKTFRSFVANARDAIKFGSTEPDCDVNPDDFDLIAILPDKVEIFIETGESIMEKSEISNG